MTKAAMLGIASSLIIQPTSFQKSLKLLLWRQGQDLDYVFATITKLPVCPFNGIEYFFFNVAILSHAVFFEEPKLIQNYYPMLSWPHSIM